MAIGSPVQCSQITDGNLGRRAGLCPAAVSRVAVLTLVGPLGFLYGVDALVPDQLRIRAEQVLEPNHPSILFVLGMKCLRLALSATLAQATTFLRARLRRR